MRPIDADQILSVANSEEKLIGKDWDYDALKTSIELAPTLDVEPVIHARWIYSVYMYDPVYICSNCKREIDEDVFDNLNKRYLGRKEKILDNIISLNSYCEDCIRGNNEEVSL